MNRTTTLLAAAAVLTLVALLTQGPRTTSSTAASTPARPSMSSTVAAPVASAAGTLSFTAASTHQLLSTNGGDAWAVIDVTASKDDVALQRVSLAVVIDVSGSMAGDKMFQARNAARALVNRLGDDDELALVAFSDRARSWSLTRMDTTGRLRAITWIDQLGPDGSTNISAGLEAGEKTLGNALGSRRLVLVSDGKATAGDVDRASLERRAMATHERGTTLTAIGVGDDFDPGLMRGLAQSGGGFYGDLRQPEALEVVLAQELELARKPLARNVTLELAPGSDVMVVSAAGRTLLPGSTVTLPDFAAGATARVLVKLQHVPGLGVVTLVSPKLSWTNTAGVREAAQASVVVARSEDAVAVAGSRDEALYADVARAFGNEQLVLASEALERGDRSNALGLLDRARAVFGTSADALAGEDAVMSDTKKRWESGSYDAKRESKDAMKKSLKTFGETNNYAY
ncbi:MAG: VWA domain-containing protein [Myxococcales bacterium]|nr:VWA domain-containing protein [Myxococcales bacterium]